MGKVIAGITMSVDGNVAGPRDGPGFGLGEGGERLHHWVFGGPWTYESRPTGSPDAQAAPWAVPLFIVTHRPQEQPPGDAFRFVDGLDLAIGQAQGAAGSRDVHVMGGADIIRQALAAGVVDELSIIVAPVVLGAGKRLFDGFDQRIGLEHLGVRQSGLATFIDYRDLPS